MHKITFECETITLMFLAGADGKTPELRAPSIKGALRFWWRAMHGHLGLDDLRKKEVEIFGGTGSNPKKNIVIIRSRIIEATITKNLKEIIGDENKKLPKEGYEGVAYLFYSTFMQRKKEKPFFSKLRFKVDLLSRELDKLKECVYCFWLLANLGALGTRSRRGAGNFIVNNVIDENNILQNLSFKTSSISNQEEMGIFLTNNIKEIKAIVGYKNTNNLEYPNLTNMKLFNGVPLQNSWLALDFMGMQYKKFRTRRNPDYTNVKEYLAHNTYFRELEKAGFGLPISYRYRSLNGKSATIEGSNRDRQRSASHLFFRVVKGREDNYFPIIITFNSKILPGTDKILVKTKGQKPLKINQPSSDIIEIFIKSLDDIFEVTI